MSTDLSPYQERLVIPVAVSQGTQIDNVGQSNDRTQCAATIIGGFHLMHKLYSSFYACVGLGLSVILLAGCATPNPEALSDSAGMTVGVGTPVIAAAETPAVGTAVLDAADDPAIWADPRDPTRGVIIGTDKKAGLYVYDLNGRQRSFIAAGRVNN
eukprot:gene24786-45656_t